MPERVTFTTYVVDSDGRVWEWERVRFAIRERTRTDRGHYPVNAYTAPLPAEEPTDA